LQIGSLSKEKLDKIKLIKNNFNFSHLDSFYFN
jgi:hypothetical protein